MNYKSAIPSVYSDVIIGFLLVVIRISVSLASEIMDAQVGKMRNVKYFSSFWVLLYVV